MASVIEMIVCPADQIGLYAVLKATDPDRRGGILAKIRPRASVTGRRVLYVVQNHPVSDWNWNHAREVSIAVAVEITREKPVY